MEIFRRWAHCIRPPSGSSVRSRASMAWSRSARRIRGRGSISASGMCNIHSAHTRNSRASSRLTRPCRCKAKACTAFRPGHSGFTANGETVVRLEQRLGYVHKGIESLMAGATIEKAAQLAGRTSGDSTVAYALAFAHAVEAALNIAVPPRAQYLRALMAELEQI